MLIAGVNWAITYSGSQLRTVPVLAVMGASFLEGLSVIPLNSHIKTLPGGAVPDLRYKSGAYPSV